MKSKPLDEKLWSQTKKEIEQIYKKWSAYASGALVKRYKEKGGKFSDKVPKEKTDLNRWFSEEWKDVGGKSYPVYRPTKRISKETPLTIKEIDIKNLKEQIEKKQKIRGTKNLPPFRQKK